MPASSQVPDPTQVIFDDERSVADAGLVLTGTLIGRLGLERTIDGKVSRGYRPGRKFLTVVSTLLAGGDCIDDINLLQADATASVVGHGTVAASTVGSWLRSLTFGHIRQLDAVCETALTRAWQAGAGPGDAPMFIDIDSTICEVHGDAKDGTERPPSEHRSHDVHDRARRQQHATIGGVGAPKQGGWMRHPVALPICRPRVDTAAWSTYVAQHDSSTPG